MTSCNFQNSKGYMYQEDQGLQSSQLDLKYLENLFYSQDLFE